jgi:hypothetical protein
MSVASGFHEVGFARISGQSPIHKLIRTILLNGSDSVIIVSVHFMTLPLVHVHMLQERRLYKGIKRPTLTDYPQGYDLSFETSWSPPSLFQTIKFPCISIDLHVA